MPATRPSLLQRLYGSLSIEGSVATGHERLASVDLLRAVAALSVLFSHAYAFPIWSQPEAATPLRVALTTAFSTGVYLFFAVSGYLIAGPFLRALIGGGEAPSASGYARRRAIRIFPAWWIALAVVILLTSPAIEAWQLALHATLTFGPVLGETHRYLSVGWTLGAEALFYVFVPIAAAVAAMASRDRPQGVRRVAAGVIGLWAASTAWALSAAVVDPLKPEPIGFLHGTLHTGFGLIGGLYHFAPGMLVFVLLHQPEALGRRVAAAVAWGSARTGALLAIAATLWIAASLAADPAGSELSSVALGQLNALACGLILFAVLTGGNRLRRPARLLAPVGLVSYGLYLWHGVLVEWAGSAEMTLLSSDLGLGGFVIRGLVLLIPALALGTASWLWIERPLLRRSAGWEQRGRKRRLAPLAARSP